MGTECGRLMRSLTVTVYCIFYHVIYLSVRALVRGPIQRRAEAVFGLSRDSL